MPELYACPHPCSLSGYDADKLSLNTDHLHRASLCLQLSMQTARPARQHWQEALASLTTQAGQKGQNVTDKYSKLYRLTPCCRPASTRRHWPAIAHTGAYHIQWSSSLRRCAHAAQLYHNRLMAGCITSPLVHAGTACRSCKRH